MDSGRPWKGRIDGGLDQSWSDRSGVRGGCIEIYLWGMGNGLGDGLARDCVRARGD